jgi:hypothetical protein
MPSAILHPNGVRQAPRKLMPQSLARILIHLVYSTKGRRPLLPHDPFPELHKFARASSSIGNVTSSK